MADHNTPAGFLSRWSQRKADVREGRAVDEPAAFATPAASTSATSSTVVSASPPVSASTDAPAPLPTLDDVQQLTPESNFAAFMSRKVAPEVKNAAMKKLFSDPHFNVMDGLDIYIDDYSQPDPLPAGMLQQMTSIDGLNLFDDKPPHPSDNLSTTQPNTTAHDHADLRLQPNPAARPEDAEPKPE
jgi:hypothetical protein